MPARCRPEETSPERGRLDRLRARTARFRRRSVVAIEWTGPIFPMGNWGPELVEVANGELGLGNTGPHSCAISSEKVRVADPEYLRYPWWSQLRAVRDGNVAFADGNLFFNRSGMTISRTAEILAGILHGIVSGETTEGRHWRWLRDLPAPGAAAT